MGLGTFPALLLARMALLASNGAARPEPLWLECEACVAARGGSAARWRRALSPRPRAVRHCLAISVPFALRLAGLLRAPPTPP